MPARPKTAPPTWADDAASWAGRVHEVTCPSGARVTYRDLTAAELAMLDELPSELLEIAAAEWGTPGGGGGLAMAADPVLSLAEDTPPAGRAAAEERSRELLRALWQVNRHLVAAALVEPKMTYDELANVPQADLQMLALLLNRATDQDAAGRHVGVVPLDSFRPALEAHGVECAPDCEACETVGRQLSTVRDG